MIKNDQLTENICNFFWEKVLKINEDESLLFKFITISLNVLSYVL